MNWKPEKILMQEKLYMFQSCK